MTAHQLRRVRRLALSHLGTAGLVLARDVLLRSLGGKTIM